MVSGAGNAILMVISFLIGAMNGAPFKYMWWFAGEQHTFSMLTSSGVLISLLTVKKLMRTICTPGLFCVQGLATPDGGREMTRSVCAGVVFTILILIQLAQRFDGANDIHRALNIVVIVFLCVYPIVWLLGSEGTASLGLSQEVIARSMFLILKCFHNSIYSSILTLCMHSFLSAPSMRVRDFSLLSIKYARLCFRRVSNFDEGCRCQVAFLTILDLLTKVGFGLYFLLNFGETIPRHDFLTGVSNVQWPLPSLQHSGAVSLPCVSLKDSLQTGFDLGIK